LQVHGGGFDSLSALYRKCCEDYMKDVFITTRCG
jgi:hypothetical protein